MIMGYDDDGARVKLCHMPLRILLSERKVRQRPDRHNPPRRGYIGGALKNWPYSRETGNGHFPFR